MLIMITFLCICGYWTWFWTHECILTIFRQVIFVDICVSIHLKLVEASWKYVQVLLMFFLRFICRYCSTFGEVLSE